MIPANYRMAMREDIPRIAAMLIAGEGKSVLVREIAMSAAFYSLTEVACGPFSNNIEFGHAVIHGVDAKTGAQKSFRIIEGGTVELRTKEYAEWYAPSFGSVRLYIPVHS